MSASLSVPLHFHWQDSEPRSGEPVTVGLPWPRGAIQDDRCFHLVEGGDRQKTLQTRVLNRWPDGSIRWCLFDFEVDRDFDEPNYQIQAGRVARAIETPEPIQQPLREFQYGLLTLGMEENGLQIRRAEHCYLLDLKVIIAEPESLAVWDFTARQTEEGPVRSRVTIHGPLIGQGSWSGQLELTLDLDFFASTPVVKARVRLRNTLAADHPGGNWDLGNGGSVYLQEFSMRIRKLNSTLSDMTLSRSSSDASMPTGPGMRLVQHSSGGDNWQSQNHLDRHRKLPTLRGYTLEQPGHATITGDRAEPILRANELALTMPYFWQNFPKSLALAEDSLELGLFPRPSISPHELQGGEQKTHTIYVAFGNDRVARASLSWARHPVIARANPGWYAQSGIISHLTPASFDPNKDYLELVNQALDGDDTFRSKREKIDEYGWRHFGDIYGDHEAVYWSGPEPMVSHYNNQYDCIYGLLVQFLRSGRPEWYTHAIECSEHTVDIDQYHTDRDKAAYNNGLFWHTYHYAPADTGTHRSYPRSLRSGHHFQSGKNLKELGQTGASLTKAYAVGGGPSSSHNYNVGLMLAYFITGENSYKTAAIELAQFVIDMEDPLRTPFRWLSRTPTGLATDSGGGGYHGPGRASGNSVLALLVGHQLTGDSKYLVKAEQLIRRVVHPHQDLDSLQLLNAELRWFYTMFLQALAKYMEYKVELNQLDQQYDYGRLCFLHYARWMLQHERPILDHPEQLQYPTETWAAQDMRKVEIFQFASRLVEGAEKQLFLNKAQWFFEDVCRRLHGFSTKSLCRPVVLMLNFGWSRADYQSRDVPALPPPRQPLVPNQLGEWRMFVPQKVVAIRRAKRLLLFGTVFLILLLVLIVTTLIAWQ